MTDKNEKRENKDKKLSNIKNILSILQTCCTIAALILVAIWFLLQGEASQKTNISYEVTHRKITEEWLWVHLNVVFSNVGKRPVNIKRGVARMQKILPLENNIHQQIIKGENPILPQKTKVQWPIISEPHDVDIDLKINSGENGSFDFEFFIPKHIKTVRIYSFFSESKEENYGWSKTIIYELK